MQVTKFNEELRTGVKITYLSTNTWPMWKVIEDKKKTESRPVSNLWLPGFTAVLHCVTPTPKWKKKISLFRHMRNICLPETPWALQKICLGGRGKKKKTQRMPKGDSSSSNPFMSLAGLFLLAHPLLTCQVPCNT